MLTNWLFNAGAVVLLLGGLIFVHELGHFLMAKALRVKVVRFSIGFGPRLFGFQRGETEYRIALLPLGGYVKMAGEDPTEEVAPEDRGRGFLEQPPWRRFLIALAGPAMNLLFPALLYFVVFLAQNGQQVPGPVVGSVIAGSPAEQAGFQPGDRILSITAPGGQAQPVRYFDDIREIVSPHIGQPLSFRVERGGRELPPLLIEPRATVDQPSPVESGERGAIGALSFYAPAVVSPSAPGAAGPLEPFDLVVRAAGKPMVRWADLSRVLEANGCAPVELTVLRERPVELPGANLSYYVPVELHAVPTCAGGKPAIVSADNFLSAFVPAVTPGTPAAAAGLKRGDAVAALDGKPVRSMYDVANFVARAKLGQPFELALTDGRKLQLQVVPESHRDSWTGDVETRPSPGFALSPQFPVSVQALEADSVPRRIGPIEAGARSVSELSGAVRKTVLVLAGLVGGRINPQKTGSIIMISAIAVQAAKKGFDVYLAFMAIISVNLGLMNLLPIPVLDGGHLATCIVEGVARRRLSVRAREIANMVGIILLVALMLYVFKNDIVRYLTRPQGS